MRDESNRWRSFKTFSFALHLFVENPHWGREEVTGLLTMLVASTLNSRKARGELCDIRGGSRTRYLAEAKRP